MRFFTIIILIFFCYSNISCRPTQLEEYGSEMNEGEYESEDSVDDQYLQEDDQAGDGENPQSENQQNNMQDTIQDSEGQAIHESRQTSNKHSGYNEESREPIAENESDINKNINQNQRNRFFIENEVSKYYSRNSELETERPQIESGYEKNSFEYKNTKNDKSLRLAPNYSGELLLQSRSGNTLRDNNALINEASNEKQLFDTKKQYDNNRFHDKQLNEEYLHHIDRDRRQAQSFDKKVVTDMNNIQNDDNKLDNTNENAILRNIKKLSEQDLEELLNSLPEDKKAFLRKIMNKREITKKAGAVEDNSNLDQSDTSKIEGSYSISSQTFVTDSTESNKHDDSSEETSTKFLCSENDSRKSDSKSGDNSDTSTINGISNIATDLEANLNYIKESLKNENKREANKDDTLNENKKYDNSRYYDEIIDDYSFEKESSDGENLLESDNKELQTQIKREISQNNPLQLSDSAKELEESFPNVCQYKGDGSIEEPLVRVKRTELRHRVKKRDLPYIASDTLSYNNYLQNEDSENIEAHKSDYNNFLDNKLKITKQNRLLLSHKNENLNKTQSTKDQKINSKQLTELSSDVQKINEADKMSLGSDTDCVLSGIEGVDDNIMLNTGVRSRRLFRYDNMIPSNTININQNNCTRNVKHNAADLIPNNFVDAS